MNLPIWIVMNDLFVFSMAEGEISPSTMYNN